ncbi:hypothetical protein VPH35_112489 [Triticum aestivum]
MMKQGTVAASGAFTGGGTIHAGAGERKLSSLPVDLAAAVEGGRVTGDIVRCFAEMERSPLLHWLVGFRGFRERLLADDLFLSKLAMEMGVGMIAKNAAEYEKRRENFVKEIDVIIADVFSLWRGVVIQGMDFPSRFWSSFSQGDGDSKGERKMLLMDLRMILATICFSEPNSFLQEFELEDGLEKEVCQRYAC